MARNEPLCSHQGVDGELRYFLHDFTLRQLADALQRDFPGVPPERILLEKRVSRGDTRQARNSSGVPGPDIEYWVARELPDDSV